MSVEAMAIALHHSRAKGTAKLILLGIANHDGDGGAWPSVKTLAKYGGCSDSQVQRSVKTLEALGEVKRYVQAGGDHTYEAHMRPNRYVVTLRCPHQCDRSAQHRMPADSTVELDLNGGPVASTRPGVTGSHPRDRVASTRPDPVAPMRPKPPTQPTTHLPETNPAYRARAKTPLWSDERCPGDWKAGTHVVGPQGRCKHCNETPAYFDPSTGETS